MVSDSFRPTLAYSLKESDLPFLPWWQCSASYKYDGIRAIVKDGTVLSRQLIPLPNRCLQKMFRHLEGLDGEIMLEKSMHVPLDHYTIQSAVRAQEGEHHFIFYIFDQFEDPDDTWLTRQRYLHMNQGIKETDDARIVGQESLQDHAHLLKFEQEALQAGQEGVIVRRHNQPYKFGRSTFNTGGLFRLKRTEDFEGVIVGFEEAQANLNEAQEDAFGLIKRSSHQENKVGKGMVGAFLVLYKGKTHRVAAGALTHNQRKELWENQELYMGDSLIARHMPYGAKDDLRHARVVSLRFDLRGRT